MCIACIANNINRNVYMYLNTRIFPTTGYARVLLFMFIRRELGGMVQDVYFSLHTVIIAGVIVSTFISILSAEGSVEPAQMRRLARAFGARTHNVYTNRNF